jgi:hypothetical protein
MIKLKIRRNGPQIHLESDGSYRGTASGREDNVESAAEGRREAAGNNVEAPVDDDGSNDVEQQPNLQKIGPASSDYDSNLSAAAGNPRGRGAGKDKGPLLRRDEGQHGGISSEEEAQDRLTNEGGPAPSTGTHRGGLSKPTWGRRARHDDRRGGHH